MNNKKDIQTSLSLTFKLLGICGIAAYTLFSCIPPYTEPEKPKEDDEQTIVLPPMVNPNCAFTENGCANGFGFRLFSPDSIDLFAPNIGSKYNYNELFIIPSTTLSFPTISAAVVIAPIVTPKIPCELMLCPVKKKFGIFVRCEMRVCIG